MKSCPVIVTEREEVAHHPQRRSERGTKAKREAHEGFEGKAEVDRGEALIIKAILVTTTKLTSSPKEPFTVETRAKTINS
jgi:hypothetical protein